MVTAGVKGRWVQGAIYRRTVTYYCWPFPPDCYISPRMRQLDYCVVMCRVRNLYIYMDGRKERKKKGNVLFNDALNTFYLQLYGVGHEVKDHSDSEKTEGRKCYI